MLSRAGPHSASACQDLFSEVQKQDATLKHFTLPTEPESLSGLGKVGAGMLGLQVGLARRQMACLLRKQVCVSHGCQGGCNGAQPAASSLTEAGSGRPGASWSRAGLLVAAATPTGHVPTGQGFFLGLRVPVLHGETFP